MKEIIKKFFQIIVLSLLSINPSWSGDPCLAWEEKTDHLVLGDCTDDIFLGYVNNTNANILGTCDDGMIVAWNDATGYMIMGTCDSEFSATYKKHGLKKFKWEKYHQ